MPIAFVTGATGFVGGHLVRQLLESGWRVVAFQRDADHPDTVPGCEVRTGDLTQREDVQRALDGAFDAVFHVAADTSMWRGNDDRQTRVNVDGTRHLLAAAQRAGTRRFVYTSTIAVYGFPTEQPIREDTVRDLRAHWVNYCRTKFAAEALVMQAASELRAVILNPTHVMGPGDRHNWVRLYKMVADGSLPGIPPATGSFADVREIARAHITAWEQGETGRNYLLGGENRSFEWLVRTIAEVLDVRVKRPVMPAFALMGMGHLQDWFSRLTRREPEVTAAGASMVCNDLAVDSARAVAELDYGITPTRELIEATCTWMREAGYLTEA
ncbi:MAG: NAD-dependent epimerase/dehydratase family protein [Pseudomonadota bacterium]